VRLQSGHAHRHVRPRRRGVQPGLCDDVMGTSVEMIELHYGTLLDGALESFAGRLDALDAERDQEAESV
jgi:hypothetical protein